MIFLHNNAIKNSFSTKIKSANLFTNKKYGSADNFEGEKGGENERREKSYQGLGRNYASISSILAKITDKTGINAWKNQVGENVADYITSSATAVGRKTHILIEDYLNNKQRVDSQSLLAEAHFEKLKENYLHKINNIFGIELTLCSDIHKIVGTADCIGEYNNKLSIIDFKTTRKAKKKEEYLKNYFLQATAYAVMWEELVPFSASKIKQIVILVSAEDNTVTEYVRDPAHYKDELLNILQKYHVTSC